MFRVTHESFQRNVSNPTQNFSVSTCHHSQFRDAKCLDFLDVSGRLLVARKSQGRFDGTHASPIAQSDPPTASLHRGLVRKAAGDTGATGPGSPVTKNVPVLRINHATPKDVLPGMRQVSQSGLACQSAHALRAGWSSVTEVSVIDGLGCAVVFGKREGAPYEKTVPSSLRLLL
jgi:hypothetical protein